MAWFLLMARKLTRGHRSVEMMKSEARQWLGQRWPSWWRQWWMIKIVDEIQMIVKMTSKRYIVYTSGQPKLNILASI